jgi:hypothetical protein
MNQRSKAVLEQPAPPPDPQARLRARRAALEEFARVHAQAQASEAEVTALPVKARRWTSQTRRYAIAAGVCVAVIGLTITLPMLSRNPELLQPRIADSAFDAPAESSSPPSAEPPAEAAGPANVAEPVDDATSPPELVRPAIEVAERSPASEPAQIAPAGSASQPEAERRAPTTAELRSAAIEGHIAQERLATLEFDAKAAESAPVTPAIVDALTAEDIGTFPDANGAESLQRVPGVPIGRTRSPLVKKEDSSRELSEVGVTGARRAARFGRAHF